MQLTIKLKPFKVPEFAIAEMPPASRQDGLREAPKFALRDLDADTLEQLCDQFRRDVFKEAGKPLPPTPDPWVGQA